MPYEIIRVTAERPDAMRGVNRLFAGAFHNEEAYESRKPRESYLRSILGLDHFICLAAVDGEEIVGGLAAYVLAKFEQERTEVYIYDLAVAEKARRKGVATALILKLKEMAKTFGAYVIFVQADKNEEDRPAIALYSKLGKKEDVWHFDIGVED